MRRRLTLAMVVMVIAALAFTGAVSLVATVHHSRTQTRQELVRQAQGLANGVRTEANAAIRVDPAASVRTILRALRSPLKLQGEAVVAVRANGSLFDPANPARPAILPSGLSLADIDPQALVVGDTVSGNYHAGVFAAVPYRAELLVGRQLRVVDLVVILTRSPPTGLAAGGPWFLVAAAVIVSLSILVANRLGHRFVRPLERAQVVTGRIAAGDLAARVDDPPGTDPELASLAASINAMAESLAHARAAERDFLLSVSHELRTPLTSIRGFAEAIEDGAIPDVGRAAAVIASESGRLERLVRDLLDLAKLATRQFSLDLGPVDLVGTVVDTAAGFGPAAERLGVTLHVDVPDGAPAWVSADADRLSQVVANLTENALSYAHAVVRIAARDLPPGPGVSAGRPHHSAAGSAHRSAPAPGPGCAVVWVDDDGPGIHAADLPRVFERLFSARPAAATGVGSGLGLAIVAELVTAMGGSVHAESPLDARGGSRIVVILPAASSAPPRDGPDLARDVERP